MAKQIIEYPYLDEDGTIGSYYIDPDTNKLVESLEDIDLSDLENMDELDVINGYTGEKSSAKDEPEMIQQGFIPKDRTGDKNPMGEKAGPRTAADNYGYIDAPRAMDFAGMMPGPIGFAAKATEAAINANNAEAKNTARRAMGLPEKSVVKGMLSEAGFRNSQGKIADVSINANNYSVGLEALDADGRTTLTPEESRKRAATLGGLVELNKEDAKAAIKDFKQNPPQQYAARLAETINPAPLGAVTAQSLDPVGTKQPQVTRNYFDMAPQIDYTAKAIAGPQVDANPVSAALGLAGISPSFANRVTNGINYSHPERGPVNQGLNERTVETMNALASNTPGGINVTSAFRDPHVNETVGGAKNSLHSQGAAFDVSTRGLNDQQKRDLVERGIMSGAMELGTYRDQSLHFASTQRVAPLDPAVTGGVTAMYNRTRMDFDQAPDWFQDGVKVSRLAPTPTPRPDPATVPGFMNEIKTNPVDLNGLSATAAQGVSWNDEDRDLAARTLAGEIDLGKTDLGTEEGRKEAMGIMSTIDNRAPKYGSVKEAIQAPAQYSTWNNQQAAMTAQKNFDLNPDLYRGMVNDYLSDTKKNNLGYTSYHANTVNPDWSGTMANKSVIGAHTFGVLNEYKALDNVAFTNTVAPTTAFNPSAPAPTTKAAVGFMSSQPETATTNNQNTTDKSKETADKSKDTSTGNSGGNSSSGSTGGMGDMGGMGSTGANHSSTDSHEGKSKDDRF